MPFTTKSGSTVLRDLHDPLDGMGLPASVHAKSVNTGYLRRDVPEDARITEPLPFDDEPYILVTPGGGGDGVEMVDWVMRAYESRAQPLFPALIVLGPFMPAQATADFQARAEHLRDVSHIALPADHRALHGRRQGDRRHGRLQTPSARSCPSTSRRCWCRASCRAASSRSARSGRKRSASSRSCRSTTIPMSTR